MPSPRSQRLLLILLATFAWTLTCTLDAGAAPRPAAALPVQLKLPKKKSQPKQESPKPKEVDDEQAKGSGKGRLTPHIVCSVCFERNENATFDSGSDNGIQNANCRVCRKVTLHRQVRAEKRGVASGLKVPSSRGASDKDAQAAKAAEAERAKEAAESSRSFSRAVGNVFREVGEFDRIHAPLALKAVDTLSLLGEEARHAARLELSSDHAATVLVAARVLWRHGAPEDLELLARRLGTRMPGRAAATMLEEFVAADPVRATPAYLARLLDHPQSTMRLAVFRQLDGTLTPDQVNILSVPLASRRSETRLRAVNLLRSMSETAWDGATDQGEEQEREAAARARPVTQTLIQLLADPTARVASAASQALSEWPFIEVEAELITRAFADRWVLRPNAYALLALVQREDREVKALLDARHVEPLLGGLSSSSPFVSGACATALAGIGFRSSLDDSTWLEKEVIDRLVFAVSGQEFHNDYSSLLGPAAARLELVTGERFGTDGARWVSFWLDHRDDFTAQRAALELESFDIARLTLAVRPAGSERSFCLVGPDVTPEEEEPLERRGELFYLTAAECQAFVDVARREGLLDATHLPGLRGSLRDSVRQLELAVGDQRKSFTFGIDAGTGDSAWFDRALAAAQSLRDANLWQRYPSGAVASRREFWAAEAASWAAETDETQRRTKLKRAVLQHLNGQRLIDRRAGLRELERLYAAEDCRELDDFAAFMRLMRQESVYGERSRMLLELALQAGMAGGRLELELAEDLWELCIGSFGMQIPEALRRTLEVADHDLLENALVDRRSPVRSVAIGELTSRTLAGTVDREVSQGRLMALAKDNTPAVRAASYLALGKLKIEDAREDLLIQARTARSPVREACLRGIGLLGGPFAFNVLIQGLADPNAETKLASLEGLADLADASSAPILMTYLGREKTPELSRAAERGLARLGEIAEPELLRAARTTDFRAQRQSAFLLARLGTPQAASILMERITKDPEDDEAMFELAVLTGIDFSSQSSPADDWWDWWDTVVHDDSLSWFRAALERRGHAAPPAEEFAPAFPGTARYLRGLIQGWLTEEGVEHLLERSRREIARIMGREIEPLPPGSLARSEWLKDLTETLDE